MNKIIFVTVLVLSLVGSAYLQDGQQQNQQQGPMRLPFMQNQQQSGQQQGGFGQMLMQIPQRGVEMIGQVLNGVRNMISGMGRNGNNQQRGPFDQLNSMNPLNNNGQSMPSMPQLNNLIPGSNDMMSNLNNMNPLQNTPLNNIVRPVSDALQQGRLPDMNQLGQGISNTVSELSNALPMNMNNMANNLPNMPQMS